MLIRLAQLAFLLLEVLVMLGPVDAAADSGPNIAYFADDKSVPLAHLSLFLLLLVLAGYIQDFPVLLLLPGAVGHLLDDALAALDGPEGLEEPEVLLVLAVLEVALVLGGDAVAVLEGLVGHLHGLAGVRQKPVVAPLVLQVQHDAALAVPDIIAVH